MRHYPFLKLRCGSPARVPFVRGYKMQASEFVAPSEAVVWGHGRRQHPWHLSVIRKKTEGGGGMALCHHVPDGNRALRARQEINEQFGG
jgi:hypothetical protein